MHIYTVRIIYLDSYCCLTCPKTNKCNQSEMRCTLSCHTLTPSPPHSHSQGYPCYTAGQYSNPKALPIFRCTRQSRKNIGHNKSFVGTFRAGLRAWGGVWLFSMGTTRGVGCRGTTHSISIRRKMCAKFNRIFCATLEAATTIAQPVRGVCGCVYECVCYALLFIINTHTHARTHCYS